MRELIKFELKKIFGNKIVWITSLMVILFVVVLYYVNLNGTKEALGTREQVKSKAESFIKGDYSKDDIKELRKEVKRKSSNGGKITEEEKLLNYYPNSFVVADKNENEMDIENINVSINKIDGNSMDDRFQYSNLLRAKEMIEKLPEKESLFIGDWKKLLDFDKAGIMKIILLVVGLAGIFSKDYSNGVSYINLSSKNGKTKLNTAKIISAFIYATAVFVFVTITFALTTFYLGLPNGDKAISNITNSLYNISINEYFLYTSLFSYFGILIFAMGIIILSLITKNIVLECGIPIFVYSLPDLFELKSFYYFKYIDLSQILRGKKLLGVFNNLNLFGNAVLYPYVIISFGAVVFIIMCLLYRRFGKNQSIV